VGNGQTQQAVHDSPPELAFPHESLAGVQFIVIPAHGGKHHNVRFRYRPAWSYKLIAN
jgi:hypothetical protein